MAVFPQYDHVRLSETITVGRLRALLNHKRSRVRDKWAGAFVMSPDIIRAATPALVITRLRRLHESGIQFTHRGTLRLVRALNKCGHRVTSR
jgi:hypothetical protein